MRNGFNCEAATLTVFLDTTKIMATYCDLDMQTFSEYMAKQRINASPYQVGQRLIEYQKWASPIEWIITDVYIDGNYKLKFRLAGTQDGIAILPQTFSEYEIERMSKPPQPGRFRSLDANWIEL